MFHVNCLMSLVVFGFLIPRYRYYDGIVTGVSLLGYRTGGIVTEGIVTGVSLLRVSLLGYRYWGIVTRGIVTGVSLVVLEGTVYGFYQRVGRNENH